MAQRVTPMIHVPDVAATVAWYRALGFAVLDTAEHDGEVAWALLSFGDGNVMFDEGGRAAADDRREVDLYVHTGGVDALYERLRAGADVREAPHDTFYGMREFIIRDLNGFWITFGEHVGAR